MYFCASKRHENCDYYRTKNPLEEPFEKIEGTFPFWDPDLFLDDDGKLYFYWGCSNVTPIYGVELDRETMRPKTEPLVMFDSNDTVWAMSAAVRIIIRQKRQRRLRLVFSR